MLATNYGGLSSLFLALLFVVAPLSAILSALTTPSATFRQAKSSKLLWVFLPWFFGFIAAGCYWVFVYPRLKAVRSR